MKKKIISTMLASTIALSPMNVPKVDAVGFYDLNDGISKIGNTITSLSVATFFVALAFLTIGAIKAGKTISKDYGKLKNVIYDVADNIPNSEAEREEALNYNSKDIKSWNPIKVANGALKKGLLAFEGAVKKNIKNNKKPMISQHVNEFNIIEKNKNEVNLIVDKPKNNSKENSNPEAFENKIDEKSVNINKEALNSVSHGALDEEDYDNIEFNFGD